MKPYYEADGVTLYCGDCREILPSLDLSAVRVAIADPPYGQTSLKWDRWVSGWPSLIPCNSLWCFGSLRMFTDNWQDFAGWKLAQDIIWEKHNGSSFHADRFRRVHEQVAHFYRGEWSEQVRNVPTTADATKRTVRRKERPAHMGEIADSNYRSEDGGPRLMRSVIQCRSMHGKALHPTQKPVGIVAPLIEFSTVAGDLILDPFAGVGTVLVAAKQSGRHAIGCEVSEEYAEITANRLRQRVLQFG